MGATFLSDVKGSFRISAISAASPAPHAEVNGKYFRAARTDRIEDLCIRVGNRSDARVPTPLLLARVSIFRLSFAEAVEF
jgi:hypothetical protein